MRMSNWSSGSGYICRMPNFASKAFDSVLPLCLNRFDDCCKIYRRHFYIWHMRYILWFFVFQIRTNWEPYCLVYAYTYTLQKECVKINFLITLLWKRSCALNVLSACILIILPEEVHWIFVALKNLNWMTGFIHSLTICHFVLTCAGWVGGGGGCSEQHLWLFLCKVNFWICTFSRKLLFIWHLFCTLS
jgi:hypothetical protein